jgi:alpha-tubulin suppressor-like RCC1 family protein
VVGGLRFRQVIAGAFHTCGATTDFRGYCWGAGALGNATTLRSAAPVLVSGGLRFRTVVAGGGLILIPSEEQEQFASCGITTDSLAYCWGDASTGVLGTGGGGALTPLRVAGGHKFRGINMGNAHACAVTPWDVAFCWGTNTHGQVGDGTIVTRYKPVRVAGGLQFNSVTTNPYSEHSCGVTVAFKAYCWGFNVNGQVGDGTTTSRSVPVPVAGVP